jgi:hypothetical protein
MMKRSGMSSDGKKRTKAPGETVLAWMERWTSFVKMSETKIVEKQKGTSVANHLLQKQSTKIETKCQEKRRDDWNEMLISRTCCRTRGAERIILQVPRDKKTEQGKWIFKKKGHGKVTRERLQVIKRNLSLSRISW